MLITTIIPNYNYGTFVRRAVDSVLTQTHPDVELIVVDDGSTDRSLELLRSYGARIRVVAQANAGVSRARNRGIDLARGEYVAFLDADDEWAPTKLAAQVAEMKPGIGLVHCAVEEIDEGGQALGIVRGGAVGRPLEAHLLLQTTVLGGGSGALVRRASLERLGGFDPLLSTSADWDMWRRIMTHEDVAFVDAPLVRYRHHAAAMHRNVAAFERDMLRAFDRAFTDPAAAAVFSRRRQAYARLYSLLFLEYARLGAAKSAAAYAVRGAVLDPAVFARRVAGVVVRRFEKLRPRGATS